MMFYVSLKMTEARNPRVIARTPKESFPLCIGRSFSMTVKDECRWERQLEDFGHNNFITGLMNGDGDMFI